MEKRFKDQVAIVTEGRTTYEQHLRILDEQKNRRTSTHY
jgi:hypothetical protein